METHSAETVLQIVGWFLKVGILITAHNQVVVRIDQLLAFTGNDFLHTFDVLHSHLVGWVRYGRMTVLLFLQQGHFPFLVRHEYHLIVDDSFSSRYAVYQ